VPARRIELSRGGYTILRLGAGEFPMSKFVFSLLAAAAALSAVPAAAEDDCRLQLAATLPVTLEHGGRAIMVTAAVNGQPVKLQVDTGAENSLLRETTAEKLGLKYNMLKRYQHASIYGGVRMHRFTLLQDFTLGKLKASGITFLLMPEDDKVKGVPDGLLGGNILSVYDVDFDFAHGKMNLFLPHRCAGKAVYWTQDENAIARIPFKFDGHIELPVAVDGKEMAAALDTGAHDTVMDLEADLPKFGLTVKSPGMVPVESGHAAGQSYLYTFKTMAFGGVTVNNPKVRFISEEYSHVYRDRMLLGMDILSQLHLFIAYREHMIYVTAAGAQ
jgi:predicted aspartyl protease